MTLLLAMHAINTKKDVKITKKIEIPSSPNVSLIPSELIHDEPKKVNSLKKFNGVSELRFEVFNKAKYELFAVVVFANTQNNNEYRKCKPANNFANLRIKTVCPEKIGNKKNIEINSGENINNFIEIKLFIC